MNINNHKLNFGYFNWPLFPTDIINCIKSQENLAVVYSLMLFINPIQANVPFLHPLKTSEGFLTFTGGIVMQHWYKMV